MGNHTEAYYRDEESVRFLNTDKYGKIKKEKVDQIKEYQNTIWDKFGPKTERINFKNNFILSNGEENK